LTCAKCGRTGLALSEGVFRKHGKVKGAGGMDRYFFGCRDCIIGSDNEKSSEEQRTDRPGS
jgi:hypothetical protein